MIARNEEGCIQDCLDSVKGIVDEMIVVDTGSDDRTIKIAEACGASVVSFAWNGNFADARNIGISHATGEWVLYLDADETVDVQHRSTLREVLHSQKWLGSVQVVNYYGASPPVPHRSNRIAQYRLFRNHPALRFQNPIHEQLSPGFGLTDQDIVTLPVTVHHYGYLDDIVCSKRKSERNLQLIRSVCTEEGHDPWFDYHLGSELYRVGNYGEAMDCINTAIIGFLSKNRLPPSLLYRLKYLLFIETGNYAKAWPNIENAIRLYPDYVDLQLYKGIILLNLKQYEPAIQAFYRCLELGEHNVTHLTATGSGSFQAWYYIGCCHKQLGMLMEAQKAFDMAQKLLTDQNMATQGFNL